MDRTVEKIVINSEGIDVISNTNGVNNVTQLSLEPQGNEVMQIFQRYNLETGVIYHYDEKIIRALAENREQLTDYLETCRRASYPAKKVDIPDTIPQIEYDLRGLKDSFQNIQDDSLRKMKQIQMYNKAKEVHNMFRSKATMRMGILDRAYFSVQELLQNRNIKTQPLLLGAGSARNIVNEKNPDEVNDFRESIKVELPANERPVNEETTDKVPEKTPEIEPSKDDDEELAI